MKSGSAERAFGVFNKMVAEGVLLRYAIGGAMGALFYSEPSATYDLDVFVLLPADSSRSPLTPLAQLYEFARARGFTARQEHILIEGIPVQFLPAPTPLVAEAVEKAVLRKVGKTSVRVMSAEHLASIMVQVGRPKDKIRLSAFFSEGVLDTGVFGEILRAHGLWTKWGKLRREVGADEP